jgi:hypothetical protein
MVFEVVIFILVVVLMLLTMLLAPPSAKMLAPAPDKVKSFPLFIKS